MSRFLLVVPPLVGHVNPLVGVAAELAARGHTVAWAGYGDQIRTLAGADQVVFECAMPDSSLVRPPELTGPSAFRFLWAEFLIPLAELMAPGVAAAIAEFRPDVVVTDQHAVAGAMVAERAGVVHVTSASTSAELIDPLAELPKVAAWLTDRFAELRARIGSPEASSDPRFSPHGVVAFTGRALVGDALEHDVLMVGPAIAPRPTGEFPWAALDSPTVLVTLGTANVDAGARFLRTAVDALPSLGVQGIVVDPGHLLGEVPDGIIVREHVPQLALLSQVDAVVCHGGHNTVCETLWHGVPLVLAPIRDDQPIIAGQVVDAGAGVRVKFSRVDPSRLATAIRTVLDPAAPHRAAAQAIAKSFRESGGVSAAADLLTRVSPSQTPRVPVSNPASSPFEAVGR